MMDRDTMKPEAPPANMLNLGQAHDNEQGDGGDQNDCHHIVDLGNEAGTLGDGGKERGDDADAGQFGVLADDREYHGGVVRDGAAVHGEADTAHHGKYGAYTGESGIEEPSLHIIVAALEDEHGAHNHMEEIHHEHEQTSKGDRDEDRTTDSDNTGAHHDEGTRTDGISEAQMEDVKQAKLFAFP